MASAASGEASPVVGCFGSKHGEVRRGEAKATAASALGEEGGTGRGGGGRSRRSSQLRRGFARAAAARDEGEREGRGPRLLKAEGEAVAWGRGKGAAAGGGVWEGHDSGGGVVRALESGTKAALLWAVGPRPGSGAGPALSAERSFF